jgi:hypothetical protein
MDLKRVMSPFENPSKTCEGPFHTVNVSGVPILIKAGSELDDLICWHLSLHSLLITIIAAHNQWLYKTCSIPYWSTSVFYCDWLGSDLWVGHFFCESLRTNDERWMTYDWITNQSRSQSFFATGGLPSINSSWRQASWNPRPEIFSTEYLQL